ncbi:prepilin-type N-terminal cleavage/methylation domain-containing protein [Patescibacteria group bacterium]|nr:MAG: prepilin-type N-terminal cleavage/methylation domain-containing protein [Patescibacteria group bacterium]
MRGFTLIETTVVLALMLMLAGLGATLSFAFLSTQRLAAAAETVAAEIAQARSDAFTQTDDQAHGVAVFTDHVVRFAGTTYATRVPSKDVTTDLPGPVTLSGLTEIVFPSGSLRPVMDGTFTLKDGDQSYFIHVSPYGVVEWEKGTE